MIDFITKAYVFKNMAADAFDYVREQFGDIKDLDTERWLHKVGLGYHRPSRGVVSGVGAFFLGALVGSALGLAFAKQPGTELRANLKEKARGMVREGERKAEELRAGQATYDQPRM